MSGAFRLNSVLLICLLSQISFASDEIRFFSFEHVKTETDARDRMVDLNVYSARPGNIYRKTPLLDYQFQEIPTGSLSATVRAIEFHRDMQLSTPEFESILKRLASAGVFNLPKSSEHRGEGNLWGLSGSINGRAFELSHRLFPQSGPRKQLDDLIKSVIREFGLDEIAGPAYGTVVRKEGKITLKPARLADRENPPAINDSEGDVVPARSTTLQELVAHPDKFDGKRVSVVGFYHGEFEGEELRAGEKTDYKKNVWCDTISTFAAAKGVAFQQDRWARVEGTFFKGPTGHMGLWPGEITRVTRFEVESQPTISMR